MRDVLAAIILLIAANPKVTLITINIIYFASQLWKLTSESDLRIHDECLDHRVIKGESRFLMTNCNLQDSQKWKSEVLKYGLMFVNFFCKENAKILS